jgi:hypothetical protein
MIRQEADHPSAERPRSGDLGGEAWIGGVSTRRVDDLVQAMGLYGISKSQVSKLCRDIDERVNTFLDRPLEGEWPYLWLDATGPWPRAGEAGPGAEAARRRSDHLGGGDSRRGRQHGRPP